MGTATSGADLVVNATNGGSIAALTAVGAVKPAGKVLTDIANPLDFTQGMPPVLNPVNTDSLGEEIQRTFPDVRVVKTLNTMNAGLMAEPGRVAGGDHSVFVAGNDADAKREVTALLTSLGHQDVIDLGDITMARGESVTASSGRGANRMPELRAAVFRVSQLVLLPVGIVAYLWGVPKLLVYSRRTAVSATLLASLYTRYMQHRLGTRPDEPAARLLMVMPNVSRAAFRLVTVPTIAGHLLTGYVPRIYRYPYEGEPPIRHQQTARTSFYDASLARHLPNVDQLVILGAGFDTRVHRLSPENRVRCFEIDLPTTQAFKLRMLKKAGLATHLSVYVPADFQATTDWYENLVAAGFDPARPAFFLWEAVTMYLDRASVEDTLRRIAGTAPGSVVAFDYFSAETITSGSPFMRYARAAAAFAGEPLTFGIDNTPPARERAKEFVVALGLNLEEHRNFGSESRWRQSPAGFVTAVVGHPAH